MCTPVYSSLLLILLATLTISIMCGTKMAAVGLPLNRWERSADYDDILAGADFLSVFMESSLRGAYKDPFPTTAQPQFPSETSSIDQDRTEPYVRTSRQASSSYQDDIIAQTTDRQFISDTTSDSSSVNDGVIVAVRVSSSISNRDKTIQNNNKLYETTETTTADFFEQRILPLEEDQSSFVAKSSKSELSAEESEPVTSDSDQHQPSSEISRRSYPSSVQGLPNANFNPTSFLSQENKDKQAFHHSFIYHDTPKLPGQARSVSYSTVIQGVSQTEKSTPIHERRERNYNNPRTPFVNSFHDLRKNETKPVLISNQNYGMSTGETNTNIKQENNWENPEVNYHESSTKLSQTTERNWEQPYTTHSQPPKVYGRPEQNYEVDEAVSVVTNGRTHGVQPSPLPSDKNKPGTGDKKDDNQKVGYVVEGRNYRKYRVEERTADGFIVGEYGVVSHDDGSLRGVRYTADGTINPRLIYDALMKFLSL